MIPNVHTNPRTYSFKGLVRLLCAYRLPLLILFSSAALITLYNCLFWQFFQERRTAGKGRTVLLRCCAFLSVGIENGLFLLVYCSFFRSVLTSGGVVGEEWEDPPQVNASRQRRDGEVWARQMKWFDEQRRTREMLALYEQQLMEALLHTGAVDRTPVPSSPQEECPSLPNVKTVDSSPIEVTVVGASGGRNPHTVTELEANGSLRFCYPCHRYKPDRSHHCRLCGRCTPFMDHHCVFLNNCISNRNYKYFFLLLFYATAASLLGFITTTSTFLFCYRGKVLWEKKGWILLCLGFFLYLLFVGNLLQQHATLLWCGKTTIVRIGEMARERFLIQQGFPCRTSWKERCEAYFLGSSLLRPSGEEEEEGRDGRERTRRELCSTRLREVFGGDRIHWKWFLPLSPT